MQTLLNTRVVAMMTGGTLIAAAFVPMLGAGLARADEQTDRKSRQYKTGALVLGAATAYFGLKSKKVVPAIIAGAGAYYAYKKSQDLERQSENDRYGRNPDDGYYNDNYPDDTYGNYPDNQRDRRYPRRDTNDNRYPDYQTYPDSSSYPVYGDNDNDNGYDCDQGEYAGNDPRHDQSRRQDSRHSAQGRRNADRSADLESDYPDYGARSVTPQRGAGTANGHYTLK